MSGVGPASGVGAGWQSPGRIPDLDEVHANASGTWILDLPVGAQRKTGVGEAQSRKWGIECIE